MFETNLTSEDGRASSVGGELANVVGAEKVDDRTVDIVTDGPDPVLPEQAGPRSSSRGRTRRLGRAGAGRLRRSAGRHRARSRSSSGGRATSTLAAVEESWRDPALDGLTIVELPERPARLQALLSGQIDRGVRAVARQPAAAGGGGLRGGLDAGALRSCRSPSRPKAGPTTRSGTCGCARPSKLRRQPEGDRERCLLAGLGEAASHGATAAAFGWHPDLEPYPYDPERALRAAGGGGFADGFERRRMSWSARSRPDSEDLPADGDRPRPRSAIDLTLEPDPLFRMATSSSWPTPGRARPSAFPGTARPT